MQNTINAPVIISGIGVHSGKEVTMKLLPAHENSGIIFKSTDGRQLQAKFDNVLSTNMSTKLSNGEFSVDVVEHLMAGLWEARIDNLVIELDSIEVPIMDGSSIEFIRRIKEAGLQAQESPRKILKVKNTIEVTDGDKYVMLKPNENGLIIDMTIDFEHPAIGMQKIVFNSSQQSFEKEFAPARTFGFVKDLDYLHSNNLALGASLDNCIGLDDYGVANPQGLRFTDEFVRHKVLDCIGDLFLSSYYLNCEVVAYKTGHKLNNKALKKLFEFDKSYTIM